MSLATGLPRWLPTLLVAATLAQAQTPVITQHNDINRTGVNPNETILNASNVNGATFGRVFSRNVDGQVYAQPLYVPGVSIPGKGTHNVVYVCTEHNGVFAFDADDPTANTPLWRVNFGVPWPSTIAAIQPEVGITSTPVIDLTTNTMYLVAESVLSGSTMFQLHALDLSTGNEKFNGPSTIQGSVPGTSPADSINGIITFNPYQHWQRTGLLLYRGSIYLGFASHGDDGKPYHGWVMAYNATTLQQTAIRNLSPSADDGGVWQSGAGLVADANGFLYVLSCQGKLTANTGGPDYGDSLVKLDTANGLAVVDYFAPSNQVYLAAGDVDFGASGAILIPGTSLIVAGSKDGKMFLANTNNLGGYHAVDQTVQTWQATYSELTTGAGGLFGGPVYYNSMLYSWGRRDVLKAFQFNGSTFNTTPVSQTTFSIPDGYSNEPSMSLSANGTTPGSAVLWAAYSTTGGSDGLAHPGILRAFDPADLTHELWNSNQNSGRDALGSWSKWTAPTIANGRVYMPTFDGLLSVYGLLPASGGGGSITGAGDNSTAPVNLTTEGTSDWVHWDTVVNRKAGVTAQIGNVLALGRSPKYNGDPRLMSWTDGAPTLTGTNDSNGLYTSYVGSGFQITAPADTTSRTLILHAGGWMSGGTLTARLSDNSGPDFVDTIATVNALYDRNYTLVYNAAHAGQTLTVIWKASSGSGNVSINGAALSITNLAASSITATAGTPQSATVNTNFPTALRATVKNINGNPVAGVPVSFSAPASGASGTFSGSAGAGAVTDATGVAVAPAFAANNVAGSYAVTATVFGVSTPATFNLTNIASQGGSSGSLTGASNSSISVVNLTTEGSDDWVHWGDASLNRKAGVTPHIGPYSVVGTGSAVRYTGDPRGLTWTDGTPTASATSNTAGLYVSSFGNGMAFSAPADGTVRTMVVHVGGWNSGATLTAHLSDGSAPDFVDTTPTASGQFDRNYTLVYASQAPGQTLIVTWKMTSGTGNVTLSGAALSVTGPGPGTIAATAGTPQSVTVGALLATALQATVKDSNNNPVSGVTVTFTAPGSGASGAFGGSATGTGATNASGVATAPAFTANTTAGSYTVTASVSGVPGAANFILTNNPGPPASISATAGTPQTKTVGTAFTTAMQATVKDANNNPVAGANVTFTAPASGASGNFSGSATAVAATNSSGVATAPTFTANGIVGTYSVTAGIAGLTAPFTLTNSAGTAASIVATAGAPQSATVNALFAAGLQATVKDAGNNAVSGVTVTFTAPAAGASGTFTGGVKTANVSTNAAGVATAPAFTAGATAGTYNVSAAVSGVATPANFSLTNNAGPAASISATVGTPQSAMVNTVFSTAMQASVRDASSNAIAGLTVTFTAPGSGASGTFTNGLAAASAVTNSSGVATAPAFTANAIGGAYAVAASVTGVAAPASFNLTNSVSASNGSLTGAASAASAAANLTPAGTADWVHWGDASLTRKAGVAVQISDYSVVGGGAATKYNPDPRPLNWTDGAPTATGSNNLNGVYKSGVGNGFSISVPADAATRTLILYVGGWNAGGTLTAHLSDTSAPDFTDTTSSVSGQFDRNYSLTYRAGNAGQTLTVTWKMASGTGNVTLSGAALTMGNAAPASLTASAGTPQSTTPSALFAIPLQATVNDAASNPVAGVTVTFTAPASGASGTFSGGSLTANAVTNGSGVATAPAFTANATGGSYTVSASASGTASTAGFILTNASAGAGGSLTGSGNSSVAAASLTSQGSRDWMHWGDASLNRKASVAAQLSTYTAVGTVVRYVGDLRPLSWTDGSPTVSSTNNTAGLYISGTNNGFSFTAPAGVTTLTLVVSVGGWNAGGTLTASLSDDSAPDFTETTATVSGQFDRNYTLVYRAASAGQTLTVTWTMASGTGNVTLSGAALQ